MPVRIAKRETSTRSAVAVPMRIGKVEPSGLVFGFANVIETPEGTSLEDLHGHLIAEEDLEAAAYGFTKAARKAGEMHESFGVGDLVESMVFTAEKLEKLGLSKSGLRKSWWVGFQLDPAGEVFKKVQSGDYSMFSIGGTALLENVEKRVEKAEGGSVEKRAWLRQLSVEEVSFVDKGANQGSHIVLWKRAPAPSAGKRFFSGLRKMWGDDHFYTPPSPRSIAEILAQEDVSERWYRIKWAFTDSMSSILSGDIPNADRLALMERSVDELGSLARDLLGKLDVAKADDAKVSAEITQRLADLDRLLAAPEGAEVVVKRLAGLFKVEPPGPAPEPAPEPPPTPPADPPAPAPPEPVANPEPAPGDLPVPPDPPSDPEPPMDLEKILKLIEEKLGKEAAVALQKVLADKDEAIAKAKAKGEPTPTPVAKTAAEIELEKRLEDATARILKMEEDQERADFTKRADREFGHVPGASVVEKGELLRLSKRHLPKEQAEVLEKLLSASNALVKKALLPVGKRGTQETMSGDAASRAEALAEEVVKKDGVSRQIALAKVLAADRALADEYYAERASAH